MKRDWGGNNIPETSEECRQLRGEGRKWIIDKYKSKVSSEELEVMLKEHFEKTERDIAQFEEKEAFEASPEGQALAAKRAEENMIAQHRHYYREGLRNQRLSPEELKKKMEEYEVDGGASIRAKEDADIQREKAAAPPPPPPPAPGDPCDCPMKLTDKQKDLHNAVKGGLGAITNPVGSAASDVSAKLAGSLLKVNSLVTAMADPLSPMFATLNAAGLGSTQLSALAGRVESMKGAADAFKNEADRLSDPATLMNLVGVAGMAGKIGCALGIEGLDVSVALSVVTENGKTSIAVSANIQADLDTMLDNVLEGTDLTGAAGALSTGINDAMAKMDEAAGAMNGMIAEGEAMMAEALGMVTEFTQVNFLANLVGDGSDPCNTLAAGIKGNLLSTEFQDFANNALASVKSPTTLGAGFR